MTASDLLTLIPLLATAIVAIITALKTQSTSRRLDENTAITQQTATLVNGQKAVLLESLAAAHAEIVALKALLSADSTLQKSRGDAHAP